MEVKPSSHRGPAVERATVMFLDIKGFTALSNEVGPETAYFAVGGCMDLIESVARLHGAAVDRYLGDCLMAVFGYPVPMPAPRRAALSAALEMRRLVDDYNRGLSFEVPLEVVIGINTGDMVAGDVRGNVVREFHVLGDAVNVAARIKAKAPLGRVLCGSATREGLTDQFEFASLGSMPLKGKRADVPIFELVDSLDARWRSALGPRDSLEPAFMGREGAQATLVAACEALVDGRGGALAILGDEGIGKSRLLAHVASPLQGVTLLELNAAAPVNARSQPLLADLVPALADSEPGDPETANAATIEAGLASLERRAGEQPVLLAIEAAAQLDADSLAALPRLVSLSVRLPLLVVLVAHEPLPAELTSALGASGEAAPVAEIRLGPLSAEESRALIHEIAEGEEKDTELIQARAAGNPRQLILATHLEAALRSEQEREGPDEAEETERRRSTILFADLTGFTAMTEQLGAERAYPIVAGCLRLLDEVATKHGGTVEKYLGDCVMALFGVTEAMEDAPRAAVNAAIEMRRRVLEYNESVDVPVALDVHSGINVGLSIAGGASGALLREFTVMGEPVDVADELKDLAPSGRVYVGGEVRRFTSEVFEYEPREPLLLKGAHEPVPVFELMTEREHLYRSQVGSEREVFSSLVGREREVTALEARMEALRNGQGGVVNVIAEAGLGKSRLVAEVEHGPASKDVRWLLGRSLSTGRRLGLHTFADLLRSWSAVDDHDDDRSVRAKLHEAIERWMPDGADEAFPFVARVLGVPLEAADQERIDALPSDAREKLVVHHLTELLRAGSEHEPLVIVMDDLHWADQSSLDLLAALLPECRERRMLFVNMFRPGLVETSERIRALAVEELADHHLELALQPLEARAARDLLGNLFRAGDLPHATRLLIEEKAKGNPFYIEEVVRALVDAGAVVSHEGRFKATDRIHQVEIPGSIHEVVQTRVDGLERGRRRLLQIASVIGQTFHLEVLRAVASDAEDVAGKVEQLQGAEFLVPSDRLPGEEYAFKHPLLQEVTYDGLLETRREELHRRVGEAVEAKLSDDIPGYHGMVAYHYIKGRDAERAEEYLLRAGEEAANSAASNEALHFFEEAAGLFLETRGADADPEKRAALETNIASALYHRGRFIDSVDHYDQALGLLGDRVRSPKTQQLGFVWDLANVVRRIYAPLRLRRPRPASERERKIMELRYARAESTTYASPTRHTFDGMRSLALVQRVDPASIPEATKMYSGAVALFAFVGISFDASRRLAEKARELAAGAAPEERLYERAMNFAYRALEGDWSAEQEIDPELVEETIARGHLWGPVTYLGLLAEKHVYQGDFAGAERATAQIDEIWEVYQYDLAKTNHYWLLTIGALERGRFDEARDAAIAYYEENPEDLLHILALGCRAKSEILIGDLDAAEATLTEADAVVARSRPVPPYHARCYRAARLQLALARLECLDPTDRKRNRGLRREAARSLKTVLASAPKLAFCRPELLLLAGRLEWVEGRTKRALRLFERSLEAAEALDAASARARVFAHAAELLPRSAGSESFRGLGAEGCQAEATRVVERLDLDVPQSEFLRA